MTYVNADHFPVGSTHRVTLNLVVKEHKAKDGKYFDTELPWYTGGNSNFIAHTYVPEPLILGAIYKDPSSELLILIEPNERYRCILNEAGTVSNNINRIEFLKTDVRARLVQAS